MEKEGLPFSANQVTF